MLRLTLDTSAVISAAQGQQHAEEIDQLAELARSGRILVALATTFDVEQRRASSENRLRNLEWLRSCPVHRHAAPFRLDYSTLGGPDVLASKNTAEASKTIEDILLAPNYRPGGFDASDADAIYRWQRKINDAQHLVAHHMSGFDAFVTRDDDDMLKKRGLLARHVGIEVLGPEEAVMRALAA